MSFTLKHYDILTSKQTIFFNSHIRYIQNNGSFFIQAMFSTIYSDDMKPFSHFLEVSDTNLKYEWSW